MRYLLSFLCFITCILTTMAQGKQEYELRPRALKVGQYDFSKFKKHYARVLHGKEANEAFKKRVMRDKEAINYFLGIPSSPEEKIEYDTHMECEVITYYPDDDVVIINTPVCLWADDVRNKRIGSDPTTYALSPSGKYRFSYFEGDGRWYLLEEKVGDVFHLKGQVYIPEGEYLPYCNFYWIDEETIYFLKEKKREDGTKYWLGYSSKFYIKTPK